MHQFNGSPLVSTESKEKKLPVLFPIFIAAFPIIHLYRENIDEVTFSLVAPSLIGTLLVTLIGWAIISSMTRNIRKSGLIISIGMTLYSFYYLYSGWIAQIVAVILLSNWLIYFIVKSKSDFKALVVFLNVSSIVAVALPGYTIAKETLFPPPMEIHNLSDVLSEKQMAMRGSTPNIYFIILDGYGGQKALEEFYMTNNSEFVQSLEEEGFWVSKASRSNYMRTVLSLPATLNMEYLEDFIEVNDLEKSDDERPFSFLIQWNYVKGFLNNFGYDTVGISSGFAGWDMIGADHYLDLKTSGMNQFTAKLNTHTPVYPILRELSFEDPFAKHRELQIQTIEAVGDIPGMFDKPTFTFAHILCPHPPFVFGKDGELVRPREPRFHLGDGNYIVGTSMDISEYRTAYAYQLKHLNKMLMTTIEKLRQRDPEAIIIIQGDHGPGSGLIWSSIQETNLRERSSILNAIYLPNRDYDDFYDTMSPVNTFRFIFNKYFGGEHEILPDRHFFSEVPYPHYMLEVTFEEDQNPVNGEKKPEAVGETTSE